MIPKTIKIPSLLLLLVLFACAQPALAQKRVLNNELIWLSYTASKSLSEKMSISAQIESRRFLFPDRQNQWHLPRINLSYSLTENVKVGVGGSYFLMAFPTDENEEIDVLREELRPHQLIEISQDLGPKLTLSHRYMFEERWIRKTANGDKIEGYNFMMRSRLMIQLTYALNNDKSSQLKVFNELFLQFANDNTENIFEHNRLYFGYMRKLNSNLTADAGYIFWNQQTPNDDVFITHHIIRFALSHKL